MANQVPVTSFSPSAGPSLVMANQVPVTRATVISSFAPSADEEVVVTVCGIGFNLGYVFSARGALNILQMLLGVISLSINAYYCQFLTLGGRNVGFLCGHPDTYFFVVSCMCLITTVLLFACCLTSLGTASLLTNTIYEISFYVLSHLLYLTSGISLLVSVFRRNADYATKEYGFEGTVAAAAIGLLNCIAYGASAGYLKWIGRRKIP